MTDAQMCQAGFELGKSLGLKRDKEHKDRWVTDWGTKTNIGLFVMLKNEIERIELEAQGPQHRCDNCAWIGPVSEMKVRWPNISGLTERLEPGGEVPSGECPKCYSLCYLDKSS